MKIPMRKLMKHKNALPDKLSELLETAIDDLLSLDRDKYIPTWDQWHTPGQGLGHGQGHDQAITEMDADENTEIDNKDNIPCAVCLAGAVIANLDGASPSSYVDVVEDVAFGDNHLIDDGDLLKKLFAIDELRAGSIWRACTTMGIELTHEQEAHINSAYYNLGCTFLDWPSAEAHMAKLRTMVTELKEIGL